MDKKEISTKKRRNNYEGHSEYMNLKEEKLKAQFFEESNKVPTEIFKGICIHVNGLTKPPLSVLRSLILGNGGDFEQYYHRDRVTHFICTHVARAKLENFIKKSHGKIKVMRPEWITDSIKYGKLLDEFDYRNYLTDHLGPKQNNLHRFFEKVQDDEEKFSPSEDLEFHDPEALNFNEFPEYTGEDEDQISDIDDIDMLADLIEDEANGQDIANKDEFEFINDSDLDSDSKDTVKLQKNISPNAKTSAHPEFLNEYYKNSRLHHLSTWREELKTFAANLMKTKTVNINRTTETLAEIIKEKIIMHVDLDCFFVAVSLLKYPERENLKGQAIAVTHARNDNFNVLDSSADISSCNYEARAFGICNDMYIRDAMKLCPDLKMIPYDFEGYNRVSRLFYEILVNRADELQAVSCDEAFIEVYVTENTDPDFFALEIRDEIRKKCGIEASIGIGPNLLLARLATRKAKPNGQFRVKTQEIDQFMASQLIKDLPGIGNALIEKLPSIAKKCSDILDMPLNDLQNRLGHRQGLNLFRKIRGEDDRSLGNQSDRKSVGSEISWGVRFASMGQCRRFLEELASEVWQRMIEAFPTINEPKPKRIQVKLYRKQEGAGQSKKHLGRGVCDTFHRSKTFPKGLIKESNFLIEIWQIFETEFLKELKTNVEDIRGIGIFLSDFGYNSKSNHKDILESFNNQQKEKEFQISESQVDFKILSELPEEIRQELENDWRNKRKGSIAINDISNLNIKAGSTSTFLKNKNNNTKMKIQKKNPSTTLTQMWGHREQREVVQLLQEISELPSEQYDHQVVMALPRELQLEIIQQWKAEQLRSEIRPCDSYPIPINEAPIESHRVLKVVECLPVEFRGQKDWTCEKIYGFILQNRNCTDPKLVSQIDNLLVDLVLHECLKPVSDSCGILKENQVFADVLGKVKRLVYDIYNSDLKF